MDYNQAFYNILDEVTEIALASSVNDMPNVRIVSFCCDDSRPGVLYFTSKGASQKVTEFTQNSKAAFATPPIGKTITHIKSNSAEVVKSQYGFHDLKDAFIAKTPEYKDIYLANADNLDVFELRVKEALVVVDYGNYGFAKFS